MKNKLKKSKTKMDPELKLNYSNYYNFINMIRESLFTIFFAFY